MDGITDFLNTNLYHILDVLPTSPFREYIDAFSSLPYLGWLNWFIPVGQIVDVLIAWCAVIGVYYLYSVILRWLRVVE